MSQVYTFKRNESFAVLTGSREVFYRVRDNLKTLKEVVVDGTKFSFVAIANLPPEEPYKLYTTIDLAVFVGQAPNERPEYLLSFEFTVNPEFPEDCDIRWMTLKLSSHEKYMNFKAFLPGGPSYFAYTANTPKHLEFIFEKDLAIVIETVDVESKTPTDLTTKLWLKMTGQDK